MQKRSLLLFSYFVLLVSLLNAQAKRALVIGINHYQPPAAYTPSANAGRLLYADLEGCLNDARGVRSLLISRFDFAEAGIDTLMDAQASRKNMMDAMNQLL